MLPTISSAQINLPGQEFSASLCFHIILDKLLYFVHHKSQSGTGSPFSSPSKGIRGDKSAGVLTLFQKLFCCLRRGWPELETAVPTQLVAGGAVATSLSAPAGVQEVLCLNFETSLWCECPKTPVAWMDLLPRNSSVFGNFQLRTAPPPFLQISREAGNCSLP